MFTRMALAGVLLAVTVTGFAVASSDPVAVVETASDELLVALDGRRDYLREHPEEIYTLVDEILLPRFDTRYSAQRVLLKHWKAATPEQRKRFVDAFYRSLLQTYAKNILDYQDDSVTVLPFRGKPGAKKARVETEVKLNDGTFAKVNYMLRRKKDVWKVYDVVIEGISYVTSFREEFSGQIAADGLEATIVRLENENEAKAAGE